MLFMRKLFCSLVLLAAQAVASAQGTFQFSVNLNGANEVPPDTSIATGSGTLSLTGSTLVYIFGGPGAFSGTTGFIDGPALPGSVGPTIFNLGAPLIAVQNPPSPGAYQFSGTINNLSPTQISQLQSGLWYVDVQSGAMPNLDIRGQILPVPEPSSLALVTCGCGLLALAFQHLDRKMRGAKP